MTRSPEGTPSRSEAPDADLYRAIVEESLVGVYTIQNGRYLYVNQGLADMLGTTRDALLEVADVMDLVAEEDREAVSEQMRQRLERRQRTAHYSFRMRHASGRSINVELYGTRLDVGGRPALAGTVVDITARRQAEADRERLIAELRDALNNVKTLSGLVPICAWCRQIRDDDGYWSEVERFIQAHTGARFTHGICPSCLEKMETTS